MDLALEFSCTLLPTHQSVCLAGVEEEHSQKKLEYEELSPFYGWRD